MGGFLQFALAVSEEARLGISVEQMDTAFRKVRHQRKPREEAVCGTRAATTTDLASEGVDATMRQR